MTREEFANMLNGRKIGEELCIGDKKIAIDNDLIVVYGASDDLTEFTGLIDDEVCALDGRIHYVAKIRSAWDLSTKEEIDRWEARNFKIEAIWAPEDVNTSWLIKTNVPHSTFDIFEYGQLYCRGIVIDVKEIQ